MNICKKNYCIRCVISIFSTVKLFLVNWNPHIKCKIEKNWFTFFFVFFLSSHIPQTAKKKTRKKKRFKFCFEQNTRCNIWLNEWIYIEKVKIFLFFCRFLWFVQETWYKSNIVALLLFFRNNNFITLFINRLTSTCQIGNECFY